MHQHHYDNAERLVSATRYNAIDSLNRCIGAIYEVKETGYSPQAARLHTIGNRLSRSIHFLKGLSV